MYKVLFVMLCVLALVFVATPALGVDTDLYTGVFGNITRIQPPNHTIQSYKFGDLYAYCASCREWKITDYHEALALLKMRADINGGANHLWLNCYSNVYNLDGDVPVFECPMSASIPTWKTYSVDGCLDIEIYQAILYPPIGSGLDIYTIPYEGAVQATHICINELFTPTIVNETVEPLPYPTP